MDLFDIRRDNLRLATIAALAQATATEPALLSQLLTPESGARVEDALARKIEVQLGLEAGWMDRSHPADTKEQQLQTLINRAAGLSATQLQHVTALVESAVHLGDTSPVDTSKPGTA